MKRVFWRKWWNGWLNGGPHFVIGDRYLLRWYLLPRNPWLNVYLHQFLHDDEDRALHDHPWRFISIMLHGAYWEVVTGGQWIFREALSVAFRDATHLHRVVLLKADGPERVPIPCWTVVITGRVVRDWGFWCPKGFVHWQDFTAPGDYGQVGKGCDG